MKEGMKLNPVIVKMVGETKAQLIVEKVEEANEKFTKELLAQFDNATKSTQAAFEEFLSNPEFDEHRATLLNTMRDSLLHDISCSLVGFSAELESELGTSYAEFAHHAIGHLEGANAHRVQRKVFGSLAGILTGLIPPEVQERLKNAQEKPDPQQGG